MRLAALPTTTSPSSRKVATEGVRKLPRELGMQRGLIGHAWAGEYEGGVLEALLDSSDSHLIAFEMNAAHAKLLATLLMRQSLYRPYCA